MKICIIAEWDILYNVVIKNHIDCILDSNVIGSTICEADDDQHQRHRLFSALYLAAFKGLGKMCEVILSQGK